MQANPRQGRWARRWQVGAIVLAGSYIACFIWLTLGRHASYNSTAFDLAFYDQILWNTAQGRLMQFTLEGVHQTNWAFHVEPILFLLAPLKWLLHDERWLLILQTLVLASGAWPVYRIARRTWKRDWAGAFFALLYLLTPTVGWSNTFDFHPLTLTTPLLLWALDQFELKHYRAFSLCLLLALLCKEEMGLVVACFGLYAWFAGRWRGGLVWGIVGVAWAVFGFFVIIPGAQGTALANQAILRYDWLFHGSLAEKIAYLTGPDTPNKLRFLFQLFLPLAFTSLLRPGILFIASPALALSLLSANPNQSSVYHHYMADVVPFLMIASIKGLYGMNHWRRSMQPRLVQRIALVFCSIMTAGLFAVFGPLAYLPKEPLAPIYVLQSGASLAGLRAAEALVNDERCLTASNNIAAHYGQRRELYVIGIGDYTACDRVLVDLADTRFVSFGSPQAYICGLLKSGWNAAFLQDNVLLVTREAAPSGLTDAAREACLSTQGGGAP